MSRALLEYFNFSVEPFGVTPDPAFLFLSPTHREALASMLHGVRSGRGFTSLIAQPGMGKTTLLFALLRNLEGTARVAFLFQTLCGPREFLRALLDDLGVEDEGTDITKMHSKLNQFLLRESLQGRQLVVIIDEAQNLDAQVLEVVRMLSNFETANRKLMHVVLAGQPELAEKLASEKLAQLRQRISIVARLSPLNSWQTREYIEHRLRIAGFASGEPLFTKEACAKIADHSRGIPRNINNLCFNALSLCCGLKCRTVQASMVQETIDDLDIRTLLPAALKTMNQAVEHRGQRVLARLREKVGTASKFVLSALIPSFEGKARPAIETRRMRTLWEIASTGLRQAASDGAGKSFQSNALLLGKTKKEGEQGPARNSMASYSRTIPQWKSAETARETPFPEFEFRAEPDQFFTSISRMHPGQLDAASLADIQVWDPQLKDPRNVALAQVLKILMELQALQENHPVPDRNPARSELAPQRVK